MEEKILDAITQYANEHEDLQVNEKIVAQIHDNSGALDSLDQRFVNHITINEERACLVQYTSEEGAVYTTYTFLNAVREIPPAEKSR